MPFQLDRKFWIREGNKATMKLWWALDEFMTVLLEYIDLYNMSYKQNGNDSMLAVAQGLFLLFQICDQHWGIIAYISVFLSKKDGAMGQKRNFLM